MLYLALMVALVVVPVVVGLIGNAGSRTRGFVLASRPVARKLLRHTADGQALVTWTAKIG